MDSQELNNIGMNRLYCFSIALLIVALLTGCAGGPPRTQQGTEQSSRTNAKVTVEAHLFDVVVKREGKHTSLRLDVFDADSMVSLGGRAYLGKGALKGKITRDSLVAYFPTSDEFTSQRWDSLLLGGDTSRDMSGIDFVHLFCQPPDTGTFADSVRVEITYYDTDKTEYYICRGGLTSELPNWGISLTYLHTKGLLRLTKFSYASRSMEINGSRREFRTDVRVPLDRFTIPIPTTASPVSL